MFGSESEDVLLHTLFIADETLKLQYLFDAVVVMLAVAVDLLY